MQTLSEQGPSEHSGRKPLPEPALDEDPGARDDRVGHVLQAILSELSRGPAPLSQLEVAASRAGCQDAAALIERLIGEQRIHPLFKRNANGTRTKVIEGYALGAPALEPPSPKEVARTAISAAIELAHQTPVALKEIYAPQVTRADFNALVKELVEQQKIHPLFGRAKDGQPSKSVQYYAFGPPPPPPPPPDAARTRRAVLTALEESPRTPLALAAYTLGLGKKEYEALLQELCGAGLIHAQHQPTSSGKASRKVAYYRFGPAPEPDAGQFLGRLQAVLERAFEAAREHRISKAAVVAALVDMSGVDRAAFQAELRKRGSEEPSPNSQVFARGAEDALSTRRDTSSISSQSDRDRVLERLHELVAQEREGALIPIRALRRAVDLGPTSFDAAVLDLADNDLLILHHHEYPSDLSENERAELVRDRYGTYYFAVALGAEVR